MSRMRVVAGAGPELSWLSDGSAGDLTGYDHAGWESSAWVLHAMHEGPPAGFPLGYAPLPPEPRRRLRWSEQARRLGLTIGAGVTAPPSRRWFPESSWSPALVAPPEGSLDETSMVALLDVLSAHSVAGRDTPCLAFYGSVAANEYDRPTLFRGPLGDIPSLLADLPGTPSNFWPDDRSWFVWTDWDLWGTKVSGSPALTGALRDHPDLETLTVADPPAGSARRPASPGH